MVKYILTRAVLATQKDRIQGPGLRIQNLKKRHPSILGPGNHLSQFSLTYSSNVLCLAPSSC